jgi:hypothetical protein
MTADPVGIVRTLKRLRAMSCEEPRELWQIQQQWQPVFRNFTFQKRVGGPTPISFRQYCRIKEVNESCRSSKEDHLEA